MTLKPPLSRFILYSTDLCWQRFHNFSTHLFFTQRSLSLGCRSRRLEMYNVLVNSTCRGLTRIPIYCPRRSQGLIRYSSTYGGSGSSGGRGVFYTVGGLTLIAGGTLAYAKYDANFNKWLRDNVPYSEVVLDNVLKDDYSAVVLDKIKDVTQVVKDKTSDITQSLGIGEKDKKSDEGLLKKKMEREATKKIQETPKAAKEPAAIKTSPAAAEPISKDSLPIVQVDYPHNPSGSFFHHKFNNTDQSNAEIRVFPEPSENNPNPDPVCVEGTALPEAKKSQPEKQEPLITEKKTTTVLPANLNKMQSEIASASKDALAAFEEATRIVANHTQKVYMAIENSIDKWDEHMWKSLKEKLKERDEAVKKAEDKFHLAREKINALRDALYGVVGNSAENARADAVKNLSALDKASLEFKKEMANASLTDQYRDRVETARKHFQTEFSTLIPSLKIGEHNKHVTAEEFDLFTYHLFKKLHYYQKELAKLETLGRESLSKALLQRGEDVTSDLNKAHVQEELDHQRRRLEAEFHDAEIKLRDMLCKQCKDEMKKASDTHARHLSDAVTARTLELERRYKRDLDEKVTSEKMKKKEEIASVMGRLKGIDAAMKARTKDDENAHKAQLLWTACQAVLRAIKAGPPSSLPWEKRLRPLQPEVAALRAAALTDDELVSVVVAGIPQVAINRGVFPEDALRERFLKVEKVARSVALVGEKGAPLPVYLLSFLQSKLLARGVGGVVGKGGGASYGIPAEELADSPIDINKLDAYDVLDRARYWMDRGDFAQALRYMNLLQGAPRVVAHDWMNETRMMLETKQAVDILCAHAFASSGHHVCPPKKQ